MLGKIEGRKRRRQQRMRWLDSITDSLDRRLSKLRDIVKDREAWHAAIHEVTRLSDYTKTTTLQIQKLRWKRCKFCPGLSH